MSDERVISQAYVDSLARNLNILAGNVQHVAQQVVQTEREIAAVNYNVEMLAAEFREFVDSANRQNVWQRALTRIVEIRQQIENDFGHHAEIRRHTTGILQATDISIIRKETISKCTEELMLAAPKYWLAPCLIALAAWIADNKELAEKALREALRRDDEKTSLLFALICRRAGRYNGCLAWLERYFSMQDPSCMEDNVLVVLDAFSNGIFGPDSKGLCIEKINSWIQELSRRDGFTEEQKERWASVLEAKKESMDNGEFTYLSQYSPTWPVLKDVLEMARTHDKINDFFAHIFNKDAAVYHIVDKIDEILDALVTNYDNEELPLRADEKKQQLIIEEQGNESRALARLDAEKAAFKEKVDFTQQLTNVAMNPEMFGASNATQKLAVAMSKEWIADGYGDITAKTRSKVPVNIDLSILEWQGTTKRGENEEEMLGLLNQFITDKINQLVESVKLEGNFWLSSIGGAALLLLGLTFNTFFLLLGAGAGAFAYIQYKNLDQRKEKIRQDMELKREKAVNILKACVAEVIDYRREYEEKDKDFEKVLEFINSLSALQYFKSRDTGARDMAI